MTDQLYCARRPLPIFDRECTERKDSERTILMKTFIGAVIISMCSVLAAAQQFSSVP